MNRKLLILMTLLLETNLSLNISINKSEREIPVQFSPGPSQIVYS